MSVRLLVVFLVLLASPLVHGDEARPDALLSIDQNRATVVDRVVKQWGEVLTSSAALDAGQLRDILTGLRADHLLAASLAGSSEGLRDVIAAALVRSDTPVNNRLLQAKALGDVATDVTYVPLTPCRLVDTRGSFSPVYAGGAFHTNEIRTYTVQGGNGTCLAQLPAGLRPAAIQMQVFAMPTTSGSGDVEILPQGASFGGTATMVYVASLAFNTVSANVKVNTASNQIGMQVRGGGANVAIDVVGYFAGPSGTGGAYFKQGGNTFGATARLGTLDNQALELYVDNQRGLRIEPNATSPNVLAGHVNNGVYTGVVGASVGGGGAAGGQNSHLQAGGIGDNCRSGFGCLNGITDSFGTIGGGAANQAGDGVGTIDDHAFATIGGGFANWAFGRYSTIAGGTTNSASGFQSTIGGGDENTALGDASTIGGGAGNNASGGTSTVGGGFLNTASGFASTVPGGQDNVAAADHSFAAGSQARIPASATGTFAWSDSTGPMNIPAGVHDAFIVGATNGIGLYTSKTFATGCAIAAGAGTWSCTSDRAQKTDISAVEARDVLERLVQMPVARWRFLGEPEAIRHVGPMAQDFRASFGLGSDDKTIAGVDADGIAFSAIQGLNAKVEEQVAAKDAAIAALKQELAELRRTVEILMARPRQ